MRQHSDNEPNKRTAWMKSCFRFFNLTTKFLPGSSVHRISQARILEWVAISFSRDLPDPGIQSASPVSPAWQADSLSADPLGIPTFWLLLHICEPLFLCGRINVCGTHDNLF